MGVKHAGTANPVQIYRFVWVPSGFLPPTERRWRILVRRGTKPNLDPTASRAHGKLSQKSQTRDNDL